MAKKAKGNRVQVILECTKTAVCRVLLATSLLRTAKIQQSVWS